MGCISNNVKKANLAEGNIYLGRHFKAKEYNVANEPNKGRFPAAVVKAESPLRCIQIQSQLERVSVQLILHFIQFGDCTKNNRFFSTTNNFATTARLPTATASNRTTTGAPAARRTPWMTSATWAPPDVRGLYYGDRTGDSEPNQSFCGYYKTHKKSSHKCHKVKFRQQIWMAHKTIPVLTNSL